MPFSAVSNDEQLLIIFHSFTHSIICQRLIIKVEVLIPEVYTVELALEGQDTASMNRRCCFFQTPPTTGQNLNYFYPYPGNQHSCLQENSVRRMQYETGVCIYNKRVLIAQDYVKFRGAGHRRIACMRFLVNNFADFPDVRVRIITISFSRWWRFRISNISGLLHMKLTRTLFPAATTS